MYPTSVEIYRKSREEVKNILEQGSKTNYKVLEFVHTQVMLKNACYVIAVEHDINLLDLKYVDIAITNDDSVVLIGAINRFNEKGSYDLKPSDFCIQDLKITKELCTFNATITNIIADNNIDIAKELLLIAEN
jgi:hypothetical protein